LRENMVPLELMKQFSQANDVLESEDFMKSLTGAGESFPCRKYA